MDHVAIMDSKRKLLPKILTGEKKIESRWYVSRFAPWNRISAGDTIYFKDSGKPVTVKAKVSKVLQFDELNEKKIKCIVRNYGKDIALSSSESEKIEWAKNKNYCILMFLENPQKIKPFKINKAGFGNACAWMVVGDVGEALRSGT